MATFGALLLLPQKCRVRVRQALSLRQLWRLLLLLVLLTLVRNSNHP
jgi:hypothetical protein